MRLDQIATLASIAFSFPLAASAAHAHALLSTASPKAGSTISASPKQITLNFTEGLEPVFSSVKVSGPGRSFGSPKISGKRMIVPVTRALSPGAYTVIWRATSVDAHKTHGSFTFTIRR